MSDSESDGENERLGETSSDFDFVDENLQLLVSKSYSLDYMKYALKLYYAINPRPD
jgi:hypothetical protein